MTPHRLPIPEDYQEPEQVTKLSACCHAPVVSARRYRSTATCPAEWDERCSACGVWDPGEAKEAVHDRP
jgi:hypothetical protein